MVEEGDFWIVRSDCVQIQGRYGPSPSSGAAGVVLAVAVGGSFLQGHRLLVETSSGGVKWDEQVVLQDFPSAFDVEGLISATYNDNGEHIDLGLALMPLRSVTAELPLGVRVIVNIWPHHLDVMVTMRPLPGGQDGHCGNMNGDPSDDTAELIAARPAGDQVPEEEQLFSTHVAPSVAAEKTAKLEDCEPTLRERAMDECKSSEPAHMASSEPEYLEDCIYDVCFAGALFAREDAVTQDLMAQRASTSLTGDCSCTPGTTTTTSGSSTPSTSSSSTAPSTVPSTSPRIPTPPASTTSSAPSTPPTETSSTSSAPTTSREENEPPSESTTTPTTTAATTTTTSVPSTTTTTTTTKQAEMVSCVAWGDPHIITFDLFRLWGSDWGSRATWTKEDAEGVEHKWGHFHIDGLYMPDYFEAGDFWLVRSEAVLVQARYLEEGQVDGVAFGGPFLQGHTLTIERMWEGAAAVYWNGQAISSPDSFDFGGFATVSFEQDAAGLFLRGVVELPGELTLRLKRWSIPCPEICASVHATVRMRRQPDVMSGQCGKADGDLTDDTSTYLNENPFAVSPELLLFQGAASSQSAGLIQRHATRGAEVAEAAAAVAARRRSNLQACTASEPTEVALNLCRAELNTTNLSATLIEPFARACAVDVCVAGDWAAGADADTAEDVEIEIEAAGEDEGAVQLGISRGRWAAGSSSTVYKEVCLDVGGGKPLNGSRIELWECGEDANRTGDAFLFPLSGSGQIRWARHSNMCLDVSQGNATNGARLQIWSCEEGHTNQQFILPSGGAAQGAIAWATHPEFCLSTDGGGGSAAPLGEAVVLWGCEEGKQDFAFDEFSSADPSAEELSG